MRSLLLVLFFLFSYFCWSQTDRYVSPAGNDSDAGTISAPWQHIQYAVDQATPGMAIHVMQGAYSEEVSFGSSGTLADPIILKNHQNEVAIIDGTGLNAFSLLTIEDQSYITISGLVIQNNTTNGGNGLLIEGNCSGIQILDTEIKNIHFSSDPNAQVTPNTAAQPLLVYGTSTTGGILNLTVRGCSVHDCRTGYSEGMAVNGNVNGFLITENDVFNITNIGIDVIGHEGTSTDPTLDQARNGIVSHNIVRDCVSPYATAAGIYVDGGKSIVVENNTVHSGQWGIEVGCENVGKSAEAIFVRNNLIYGNDGAGVSIGGYDYPNGSGKVEQVEVRHNTVFSNDQGNNFDGELILSYVESTSITHNIFHAQNQNGYLLYSDPAVLPLNTLLLYWNLWFLPASFGQPEFDFAGSNYNSLAAFQAGTGHGMNSAYGDPLFTSTALLAPDLHIAPISPAHDVGDPSFLAPSGDMDMDNEARVSGIVDLGADEYYANTSITEVDATSMIELFPMPSTGVVSWRSADIHTGTLSVDVVNDVGQVVHHGPIQNNSIDLSFLASGFYLLRLRSLQTRMEWRGSIVIEHQVGK